MERYGVVGLLVVVLPSLARAQRVEVALLGGWYQPSPNAVEGPTNIECDDVPCPYYYREARTSSSMFGGRITVELGRRVGLDATWQRSTTSARVTYSQDPGGAPIDQSSREHVVTFLALQPHVRVRWTDQVQAVVAFGPAFADVASPGVGSATNGGVWLALSVSLRARLTNVVSFDVRASDTRLVGSGDNRNHLFLGAGMAFALRQ